MTYALFFAIVVSLFFLGLTEDSKLGRIKRQVSHHALAAERGNISNVRYEVCADIADVIYYCPGDTICCTPGDPESRCCPEDHPLCIGLFCCPKGYPQICGKYCCIPGSACCNGEYCCISEAACCVGEQCCTFQAPCCKNAGTGSCCDKDSQACCDNYGCVAPCESQFDAIGCDLTTNHLDSGQEEKELHLPSKNTNAILYRILRPDEDPTKGLVAKDPSASKTVLSHVNCGSRPAYKSQYISTTSSLNVAKYYKEVGEKKGLAGLRIAEISDTSSPGCTVIDLTVEANREKYLGNAVCKNFAKKSMEVLLQCTKPVPCKVIGEATPKRVEEL